MEVHRLHKGKIYMKIRIATILVLTLLMPIAVRQPPQNYCDRIPQRTKLIPWLLRCCRTYAGPRGNTYLVCGYPQFPRIPTPQPRNPRP